MKKISILLLTLLFQLGCQKKLLVVSSDTTDFDIVANKVDSTVSPSEDFFDWANGGWFKAIPMPANESKWGIESLVNEEVFQNTIGVCRNAAISGAAEGSIEQKIGDLWSTGMDTVAINAQSAKHIEPEIKQLNSIKTLDDLSEAIGMLKTYQLNPFFDSYVYPDRMRSDRYGFYIKQAGLALSERNYYLKQDKNSEEIRRKYISYIIKLFTYQGESMRLAHQHAKIVLKLETYLAEKHLELEDLRGPYKSYNKMSISQLEKLAPSVKWRILFAKMKMPIDSVIVGQPDYIRHIDSGLKKFGIEDWKTYLKFHFLNSAAKYLSSSYNNAHFEFFDKILEGRKQQAPRWKFVLESIESVMGDGLGQLFVKDFFSEEVKNRYSNIFENVREAYAQRIMSAEWMTTETKMKALDKLRKMRKKIGYPDVWTNYSSMIIDRKSFVRNMLNANKWRHIYTIARLTKQVTRDNWNISPQEYNAYYSLPNNEIVISAAMMIIPGYTDAQIDDAVAYGYVAGSTIGHEMTHGFDLDGKEYDINGNLKSWWLPKDSANFTNRTKLLANQFSQYVVVDTFKCRGEVTLDENVADLGGVVLALHAFKNTPQYKSNKKIAGYTPLQRFFMGYALGWMLQYTKERLIRKVMTDVHAPPKLRINGILPNVPEFYEAFDIKPGDKMYIEPSKRIKIW